MMEFKFHCFKCQVPFYSSEWEMGRFSRDAKGNRKNYYVKASHDCGSVSYRPLTRKQRYEIRDNMHNEETPT